MNILTYQSLTRLGMPGRKSHCLYLAFEEWETRLYSDIQWISINLEPWVKKGLLKIQACINLLTNSNASSENAHVCII